MRSRLTSSLTTMLVIALATLVGTFVLALGAATPATAGVTSTFKAGIWAEPATWRLSSFRDSTWQNATVYSPAQVGVKDGYATIRWSPTASLIWSSDLQTDNTILLRFTAKAP